MQKKFLTFMTSTAGRGARLVMGLALAIVALVALVPIAGGLFDVCMAGLALGYGLQGSEIREKLSRS